MSQSTTSGVSFRARSIPSGPSCATATSCPSSSSASCRLSAGVEVVLDDEDAARARRCDRRPLDRGRRRREREPHDELGPGALAAARDVDRATVRLDEPLHEREAEPEPAEAAVEGRVGLRERLEEPRDHRGVDADAGVPHAEHREAHPPRRGTTGPNRRWR